MPPACCAATCSSMAWAVSSRPSPASGSSIGYWGCFTWHKEGFMLQQLLPALRIKIFLTILCGLVYPLTITAISQTLFPHQSSGSLATVNGKIVGSELIGQNFSRPEYFHPRPSAAGANGYDATASGGSNYAPGNQKLIDRVKTSMSLFHQENPDYTGPIPVSYTHLRAHETKANLECRLKKEKKA